MIDKVENPVQKIISKIIEKRTAEGLSLESVALSLGLKTPAYYKIERMESKLSVERLFKLAEILNTNVSDLMNISSEITFNQHVSEQATGYQQNAFYQDNKEIVKMYTQSLKEEIAYLREQLKLEIDKK